MSNWRESIYVYWIKTLSLSKNYLVLIGVGGIPLYLGDIFEFCSGVFIWEVFYLRTNNPFFFNLSRFPRFAPTKLSLGAKWAWMPIFVGANRGKWLKLKKNLDYLSLGKITPQTKTPLQNPRIHHHTSYP